MIRSILIAKDGKDGIRLSVKLSIKSLILMHLIGMKLTCNSILLGISEYHSTCDRGNSCNLFLGWEIALTYLFLQVFKAFCFAEQCTQLCVIFEGFLGVLYCADVIFLARLHDAQDS